MFNSKNQSVSDYVQQKVIKEPINYRTVEDEEFEKEKKKIERKVQRMMEQKLMEFSFEVAANKKHFKELDII